MATYYLINCITRGSNKGSFKQFAGELVNDANEDVAAIQAAGGVLWSSADAVVAAAAAVASKAKARGADEAELNAIMQAGINNNVKQSDQTGEAVLVAGTVTVSTLTLNAGSVVMIQKKTPGGTSGVGYKYVVTPGAPGSLVITAVDAAGATVATDTSTIAYHVIN